MSNSAKQVKSPNVTHFPTAWVMMLGVMVAIGPLAIDMYLPALPKMAQDFGVTTTDVARSVPAYFAGLVVGQLFYGPFSDRVGRVRPMYFGMVIFIIASVLCALASNETMLFFARTLQALGACVTAVVSRAAIRDTLNPIQSARAFSLMVLVMGVAPILAPTFGVLILKWSNWRMIFWLLAIYGLLNLFLTKHYLKETLAPENRNTRPIAETFVGYWQLFQDKRFVLPAMAAGLLQGAFFIYLSIASELFMEGFGLSQNAFAIAFGANAFGFIAMTQVNQFLTKRHHLVKLLRIGACMQLLCAMTLMITGMVMGHHASFWWVAATLFFGIAGLGLTQPNATAIALAFQKKRAGMASAAQGALQFSVGVFGGLLLSLVNATALVRLGVMMVLLVAIGTWLVFRLDPSIDLKNMD